jgi:ABC-type spermidine/putrescine transport system permease subunit II
MNRTVSRSLHEGTLLLWLLPLAIVCISVFVIPVIQIVRWSFSDSTLMKEGHELSLRAYIALLLVMISCRSSALRLFL